MTQTKQAIILKAIKIIETRGWYQGLRPDSTRVCVVDALMEASPTGYFEVRSPVYDLVKKQFGSLVSWNDHPTTTKEIIIETLRKAAESIND